jgi:nitrate ABC transporter ATP-binding subunit
MTLKIRGVEKSFRTPDGSFQHVLRALDLEVGEGEFVSLIGHSGCGKSTLLNLVGGLTKPDTGSIVLDGVPVSEPGPDRAMVFQSYSLLPRLSLLENVRQAARAARPGRSREATDEIVERYLSAVGLWPHRDKRPAQVSGGMAQRCAVARAFSVEPRVLLLDEPFGALDALTRARLQKQLVELWGGESETEMVLMVTHGVDEAILLADRVAVLAPPPGPSLMAELLVPIARPRDRGALVDDPAFRKVQHDLADLLAREAEEADAVEAA